MMRLELKVYELSGVLGLELVLWLGVGVITCDHILGNLCMSQNTNFGNIPSQNLPPKLLYGPDQSAWNWNDKLHSRGCTTNSRPVLKRWS